MTRSAGLALALLFFGTPVRADSQPPITELRLVLDHPVAYNGRMFEGYVYLYVGETAYYFFPHKITDAEFESADIDVMPGTAFDTKQLAGYKTGDRLRLRARIDVDLPCYAGSLCVPFRKPIFLDHFKIIR